VKFAHRIMTLPVLAAAAFLVVLVLSRFGVAEGERLIDRIETEFYAALEQSHRLEILAGQLPYTLQSAMTAGDPDMIVEAAGLRDEFQRVVAAARELPHADPAALDTLRAMCDAYFEVASLAASQMINSGIDLDESVFTNLALMRTRHEDLVEAVRVTAADRREELGSHLETTARRAQDFRGFITAIIVACLAAMVFISIGVIWSVLRPVRSIRDATEAIAHGDLHQTLDYRSADDLGRLADAFRRMQHSLITDIDRREKAEQQLLVRTDELENTLNNLRDTQTQLIQSEKMASLGQMVAGLAHELNNPVGAVSSSADVVSRARVRVDEIVAAADDLTALHADPRLRRALDALRDSAENLEYASGRIADQIHGLKNFTHLDKAELQRTDIIQGIENTLTVIKHELGDRISVVRRYGELPLVTGYPGELNQVFLNLLTNAAKAIEGEGTITITTEAGEGEVVVEVADTGVGIAPEQLDRLFDVGFTEGDDRVKMGWGLATVQQILRRHKGDIKVSSTVGEGSAFTVVLPVGPV